MRKRILSLMLSMLMLICMIPFASLPAIASPEDYLYYEIESDDVTITGCDSSISGNFIIPSSIEGYPVTGIADFCFYECTNLTAITIPDSVISISSCAFYGCSALETINIGDNVEFISYDSFDETAYYNNSSNWENNLLYVGNYLIKSNNQNSHVTIRNGTIGIADYAFSENDQMTTIQFPNNLKFIGYKAFSYCTALESISIPDSVEAIDNRAFYECTNLASISLPDLYIDLGYEAFSDTAYANNQNNWKNNALYIGNHLIEADMRKIIGSYTVLPETKYIANNAFFCPGYMGDGVTSKMTSVTIPSSVKTIGSSAFDGCTLENVFLSEGLKSIEDSAFFGNNMTTINIPASVTSIGQGVFSWCDYLTTIKVNESNNTYISYEGVLYSKNLTELIKCPEGKIGKLDIPNGVITINSNAFTMAGLTSVNLPNSIKNISERAFLGCHSLEEINIPNNVKTIEKRVFSDCYSLKKITLSNSIQVIEEGAFSDCESLSKVLYQGLPTEKSQIIIKDGNEYLLNTEWNYLFFDTPASHWAFNSIAYCYENGIMGGVGNDKFDLNGTMTRGQVVTMLYSLAGRPTVSGSSGFSDVAANAWYAKAVAWASQNSVVGGIGNGKFAPNDPVTRAEFATMLYAYARYSGENISARADLTGYPDYKSLTWEKTYIEWAVAKGLISGSSINGVIKIDAKGRATRAQGAVIMRNFCEN